MLCFAIQLAAVGYNAVANLGILTIGGGHPVPDLGVDVPVCAEQIVTGVVISESTTLSITATSTRSDDPVLDLTPLGSLTKLRSLSLSLSNIRDLSPLAALPNLQSVNIVGPENLDVTPLAHVPVVNVK